MPEMRLSAVLSAHSVWPAESRWIASVRTAAVNWSEGHVARSVVDSGDLHIIRSCGRLPTYILVMPEKSSDAQPASTRTTVRRGSKRAEYDRATMLEILRVGTVAHVGVVTDSGPLVLPMVYGITDDTMYLHGALANSLLGAAVDVDICATVTIVDGLVFAKTPFNHSMNYRSVVVRGRARLVSDKDEVLRSLQLMTDHVVPTWDVMRHPSPSEIRATRVVALSLDEMSAKVRSGGAVNVDEDESAPYWSGHVPLVARLGQPVSNDDAGDTIPTPVQNLVGQDIHARSHLDG